MSECPAERQLEVRLFGGVGVRVDGALLPPFPTQKSQSVFACLVLNDGRMVHRDVVCGWFWPELPDRDARKALRTALWRIRSVLEPGDGAPDRFLHVDGPYLGLKPHGAEWWADVWTFESALGCLSIPLRGAIREEDVRRLAEAEALYQGDLLAGSYDEWSQEHQERFRLTRLSILERLLAHHADRGEWLQAILFGRRLLRHDPLREHVHRSLMECHLRMGDRASAVRQYQACAHHLAEELDLEPMEETRRLLEGTNEAPASAATPQATPGTRSDPAAASAAPSDRIADPTLAELAHEVDGAFRNLERLIARLEARTRARLETPTATSPELRAPRTPHRSIRDRARREGTRPRSAAP